MSPFAATLGVAVAAFLVLWVVSLRTNDVSIVDVFWGPGFVLLATVAARLGGAGGPRPILVLGLVAVWGLRLGGYLWWRRRGQGEDFRYAAMRRHHGARFRLRSLGLVFGLQAVLMWIVSWPTQWVAVVAGPPLGWLDALGVGLWAVGMVFEAGGDLQLARFKADPSNAGRVMDRGLWRYTRHPNYFGDCCVWWGLYAIACAAPGGWWTLPAPVVMTVLLRRVSGVPMLERSLLKRRPGYAAYVAQTSAFFPRPPRASRADGPGTAA